MLSPRGPRRQRRIDRHEDRLDIRVAMPVAQIQVCLNRLSTHISQGRSDYGDFEPHLSFPLKSPVPMNAVKDKGALPRSSQEQHLNSVTVEKHTRSRGIFLPG